MVQDKNMNKMFNLSVVIGVRSSDMLCSYTKTPDLYLDFNKTFSKMISSNLIEKGILTGKKTKN